MDIFGILSVVSDISDLPGAIVNNVQDMSNRTRAKNRSLQQQVNFLMERLGYVSDEQRLKAYLKITILKNLAWKDDVLHEAEKLFLYDYIIDTPDLPNDEKIIFLNDILLKPKKSFFKKLFSKEKYAKEIIFDSKTEGKMFRKTIDELSLCDSEVSEKEKAYIDKISKQLGI